MSAPINTGTTSQTKAGGTLTVFDLLVNRTLSVVGGATFDGNVKIGYQSTSCTSINQGSLRYNSANKVMEVCDGSTWKNISSTTTTTTTTSNVNLSVPANAYQGGNLGISWASSGNLTACRVYTQCSNEIFYNQPASGGLTLPSNCAPGTYDESIRCFTAQEATSGMYDLLTSSGVQDSHPTNIMTNSVNFFSSPAVIKQGSATTLARTSTPGISSCRVWDPCTSQVYYDLSASDTISTGLCSSAGTYTAAVRCFTKYETGEMYNLSTSAGIKNTTTITVTP